MWTSPNLSFVRPSVATASAAPLAGDMGPFSPLPADGTLRLQEPPRVPTGGGGGIP